MPKSSVCIIQPGNIGDIIICLPIAKHYHDQGLHVYWIVWSHLVSHFNKGNIDYVQFVSVPMQSRWYEWSHEFCREKCSKPIDLSFTQFGSWHTHNTTSYQQQRDMSFDQYKYFLADVDFDLKWNLSLNRSHEREKQLYDHLRGGDDKKYCLVCDTGSDTKLNLKIDNSNYSGDILNITPITDCVFDWLLLFERCDKMILIESCFSNLLDQMNMVIDGSTLMTKKGYYGDVLVDGRHKGMPVLRGNWDTR